MAVEDSLKYCLKSLTKKKDLVLTVMGNSLLAIFQLAARTCKYCKLTPEKQCGPHSAPNEHTRCQGSDPSVVQGRCYCCWSSVRKPRSGAYTWTHNRHLCGREVTEALWDGPINEHQQCFIKKLFIKHFRSVSHFSSLFESNFLYPAMPLLTEHHWAFQFSGGLFAWFLLTGQPKVLGIGERQSKVNIFQKRKKDIFFFWPVNPCKLVTEVLSSSSLSWNILETGKSYHSVSVHRKTVK